VQVSHLLEVLGSQMDRRKGRRVNDFRIQGTWGFEHFGISYGKGGQNIHAAHGKEWIFSGITQCPWQLLLLSFFYPDVSFL